MSVGAVAPSAPSLARLMTRHIDYRQGAVIELGPGTGVFTRALVAAGLSPRQLALVEANPEFAAALSPRHPGARVICTDAAALIDALPLFGHALAGTVISGLPLRSMPSEQVTLIVRGVFERQLRSDGAFFYLPMACVAQFRARSLSSWT